MQTSRGGVPPASWGKCPRDSDAPLTVKTALQPHDVSATAPRAVHPDTSMHSRGSFLGQQALCLHLSGEYCPRPHPAAGPRATGTLLRALVWHKELLPYQFSQISLDTPPVWSRAPDGSIRVCVLFFPARWGAPTGTHMYNPVPSICPLGVAELCWGNEQ